MKEQLEQDIAALEANFTASQLQDVKALHALYQSLNYLEETEILDGV